MQTKINIYSQLVLIAMILAFTISCASYSGVEFRHRKSIGKVVEIEGRFCDDAKTPGVYFEISHFNGRELKSSKLIYLSSEIAEFWGKEISLQGLDKEGRYLIVGYTNGGYAGLPEGAHDYVSAYESSDFSFRYWFEVLSIKAIGN